MLLAQRLVAHCLQGIGVGAADQDDPLCDGVGIAAQALLFSPGPARRLIVLQQMRADDPRPLGPLRQDWSCVIR